MVLLRWQAIHVFPIYAFTGAKVKTLSIGQNRFPNHFPSPPRALYTTWYKFGLGRNHCISQLVHTFGTSDLNGQNKYTCDKNGCTCIGILCNLVTLTLPKAQAGNNNQGNPEADCFVVESFNLTAPGHMRMGFGDSDKADVQHQIVVTGISSGKSHDCFIFIFTCFDTKWIVWTK